MAFGLFRCGIYLAEVWRLSRSSVAFGALWHSVLRSPCLRGVVPESLGIRPWRGIVGNEATQVGASAVNEQLVAVRVGWGGGLLLGSKEFNRCFCANIAALGYIVYSIEYRLIPDCNFFNQLDDVERAFDYISARIESDNGDSKHIYASADSGGACLLTYATAVNGSRDIARAAHVRPSGIKFNAIGFISGMFYTDRFDKIGLFLPNYLYGRGYKKNRFAPYVNPGNNDIIKTLPPCYMVTSHNDYLQKYTLDYEKALTKGGIRHKLDNYPKNKKLTHAFSVFEPFMDESFEVIHSMTEFFSHY